MKKILCLALSLLMTAALLTGCSKKDNSDWSYIKGNGKMVIGVTDFDPMDYRDENGKWIGFDAEYAEAVCAKLGVTAEFKEIDWDNKELELQTKSIDCIWNGMTITDAILEAADVTGAYLRNYQVVVVKDAEAYTSLESLKGKAVVAESGSAGEDAAKDDEYLCENYKPVGSQADALLQVKSGAADACVIDYVMAESLLSGGSYSELSMVEGVKLGIEEYGIAFRSGSDMVAKVDEITAELYNDGTILMIAEKYNQADKLITPFAPYDNSSK